MNLKATYIEISSEEEMNKAYDWLKSLEYKYNTDSPPSFHKDGTYLFIASNNKFHFNNGDKQSYWKPFSVLYDEGMPRDVVRDKTGHITTNEEDLLAKAKRLYPIGTKYKSAAGGYEVHTVESMDWAPWSPSGDIYGEISKGCIYKHGKWAEIVHEVKPIKKKEVISDNLSNYIGRYLEALVNSPHGGTVKKGEYGLIINHSQANFPSQIGYHCSEALKKNNLNIRYRLMPEGFTPLVKEEEWKPQVGDWVVTDNLSNRMGGMYNGNLGQVWQIGKIINYWYSPVESMKFTGGSLELHNLRKATLAEINSVCKKEEVLTSNQSTYQPIVTSYSYNGVKETHQSINKTGKQFSPIKVELIKVKQLKIN